jgi:hypothetical protein
VEENSQKRANAGGRKPETVRHDQLNLSLARAFFRASQAQYLEQKRDAAERRVGNGFPQCPQLSAFLGSGAGLGTGELSASSTKCLD